MHKFLKQFITHPRKTGAVAASSKHLARSIVATANLAQARVVVELGPGTGVFTEKILQHLPRGAVFFALELNPGFVAETRKHCPTATVYHDSALHIKKYLRQHGVEHCDCIISSLPWGVFKKSQQAELLDAIIGALHHNGEFLTFTYLGGLLLPSARDFLKLLRSYFMIVRKTPVVWRNIPPAFIYHCRHGSAAPVKHR
ncbi:MAG: hypothetical protein NTV49_10595 [Kiritimatiellaeota bacterium]|nr:hypothetical protein [Kiritimatiellota bacterium]